MEVALIFSVPGLIGGLVGFVCAARGGATVFWGVLGAAAVLATGFWAMAQGSQGWDGIGYVIGLVLVLVGGAGHLLGGLIHLIRSKGRPS